MLSTSGLSFNGSGSSSHTEQISFTSLLQCRVLWVSAKEASAFLSGILDQEAAAVGAGGD
jgi:hypothetical protein